MHIPGTPHTVYVNNCCGECERAKENNPDPTQWKLVRYIEQDDLLLLWVTYTNIKSDRFEKDKIMVVKASIADFLIDKTLDPHFAKDGKILARFRPNEEGWADGGVYLRGKKKPVMRGQSHADGIYKG